MRQDLYDELDAATLAADYAEDAIIKSPIAGVIPDLPPPNTGLKKERVALGSIGASCQ